MIRPVMAQHVTLVAACIVGAQASCALLYDFTGEGGADATTTGKSTDAGASASRSTSDGIAAASASASSGDARWRCTSESDCFGAACNPDGTCDDAVISLQSAGRGLHIHKVGDVPTVSVVRRVTSPSPGMAVSIVSGLSAAIVTTTPFTANVGAYTGFFAHDEDEIIVRLPIEGTAYRYADDMWGAPANINLPPPDGSGGNLNMLLSTEYGWIGVANDKLLTFAPTADAWIFDDTSVDPMAAHIEWLGHGVVHHDGAAYALSMFSEASAPGCLALAERAAAKWEVQCRIFNVTRASGLASDGELIVYRSQEIDGMAGLVDVVSSWDPVTDATRKISRTPAGSFQSVAVDGDSVYFDANTQSSGPALFRCNKADNASMPPDDVCEELAPGAIDGLGSLRLAEQPDERFLVCWMQGTQLTCRVST